MGETVVRAAGLTRYYGRQRGIIDLDLEIAAGEVFGYLGPNGAGKTTTIRLLLDYLRPSRGSASLFGFDAHRSWRSSIGISMRDVPTVVYPNLPIHSFADG